MNGTSAALLFAAVVAGTLASALVRAGLRRRSRRTAPPSRVPGLRHLASYVSDLSGAGILLPASRRDLVSRRRLGALLGPR